jgi:hypothetical protein
MINKELGLPMAKTKIGLPENRKRLRGAGVEKARNTLFDLGYDAGFKAGIEYQKQQSLNKDKK